MSEKKEPVKISISTFFLILAIIVIAVMAYVMYVQKTTANKQIATDMKNTSSTLQDTEEISNMGDNTTSKFIVPSLITAKSKKVDDTLEYNVVDDNRNFNITINDGVPNIIAYTTKSEIAEYASINESNVKVGTTAQTITGFNKKVVDLCIILDNHEPGTDTFLFLMEDGTVEYSSYKNMVQNVSTQGAIKELKNIVKLQKVEFTDGVSGDTSAMAIDNENNCYDVRQYLNN